MATKVKDYYNADYAQSLAEELALWNPKFDKTGFLQSVLPTLETIEFGDRQILLATTIAEHMHLGYGETLEVFYHLLGEELVGTMGAFTEGWRLWPLGKYVELYGTQDYEASIAFSKELTKRFTSEFCMRPLLEHKPAESFVILKQWSLDENPRVRRLASECMRIRLPWAKKSSLVLSYFDDFLEILENLKDDKDKAIQKSVANNLNDLYKEDLALFETVIAKWEAECRTEACAWVLKHAQRTRRKANSLYENNPNKP